MLNVLISNILTAVVVPVQRDLIEPAVKGTSNVLRSVARNRKTVRRVVFSSSIAGTFSSFWSSFV